MPQLRDDVRVLIRRMFFSERLSIEQIAERIGFSTHTVRRAIVIDGGIRAIPEPGPYHEENES